MVQRILGFIGWLGTALVFAAVAVRFLRPEWDQYAVWGAWAGLACVLLYTAGQWREIGTYFRRRQARYGALATVSVLIALGVVIVLNVLGNRQNKRWDLTANKQFSLSEQTVKVLQTLDAPVKFTVFDRSTGFDRFRNRLDEYDYHSDKVTVEYIDPDTKPMQARQYEIQSYGTVVVEYKDRRERVTADGEQELTNALIKAVSGKERTVYFLQGHGEKDPMGSDRDGYSSVAEALKRDNYKVEKLALAQQKDVPADATAIVIAGPTSDLLQGETDALRRYLTKAGKLMVLLDPAVGKAGGDLPTLEGLLKEWAFNVGRNIVVDVSGATNEPSMAVALNYPSHAITERFGTLTVYPLARSVEPVSGGAGGRFATTIVETSARSWAETSIDALGGGKGVEMEADKGDKAGPISIAAAVSADPAEAPPPDPTAKPEDNAPKPQTRVVVFGDSDFATNAYGGIPGNPNLFANAVNWLAQQENLIAIRPKQPDDRRITLTARQQQGVFWTSMVVVPLLVFGTGIAVWRRKRA